jgi:hypothetical protein
VASGTFEKNSIGWQIQQMQQRIGEWLEQIFTPFNWSPEVSAPPEWLMKSLFWSIAIALTGWIGWQLYQLLRPYFYPVLWAQREPQLNQTDSASHENLTIAQWLQRSRTFALAGNYREACRALYLATIQRLDNDKQIPNVLSRTDGEYLRLVQTLANPQPYEVLIRTHEWLCFGHQDISAEMFERCQQAYQEIEPP